LRDLPSLASLPSAPNSFNSATIASSTGGSFQSHNQFASSNNALFASTSESKASNSSRGNLDSNNKQTNGVTKLISSKMDKFLNKYSSDKLNRDHSELKHLHKQRIQLYDRINMQNKLKEHTYSPLHFWNEKKLEHKKSKIFASSEHLSKSAARTFPKKSLKNYITYKIKTDNRKNTRNQSNVAEEKKEPIVTTLQRQNQQKQLDTLNKLKKAFKSMETESKQPRITVVTSFRRSKKEDINEEYNYAQSQKSINTSSSQSSNENQQYEDYPVNRRKEYEIKIINNNEILSKNETKEDYEDPQFPNEYDDVDDQILNQEANKPESCLTLNDETLAVLAAPRIKINLSESNEKNRVSECDCKQHEKSSKRNSFSNKTFINTKNKQIETDCHSIKNNKILDNDDNVIACTSF
jgi:hypothetical protein